MTEDNVTMPGGDGDMTLFGKRPAAPAGVKEAARLALSAALRDPRTGFAIKAGMIGGAYEAFAEAVEAAITAEREKWKDAVEAAFEEGVEQARKPRPKNPCVLCFEESDNDLLTDVCRDCEARYSDEGSP
jgi:hypothetical protein